MNQEALRAVSPAPNAETSTRRGAPALLRPSITPGRLICMKDLSEGLPVMATTTASAPRADWAMASESAADPRMTDRFGAAAIASGRRATTVTS